MKRKLALGLVGLLVISSVTGCGKAKSKYLLDVDYSDYVKLCEYEGVEADKVVFEVSEDEIQEQIDMEMYDYATYDEITDRGIEVGDYAVISYDAKLDGKESEDYSGKEEEIVVGEEFFYPEVEEALVGMKTGDKKTVDLTLTEDFAEEGDAGKKLSLDVSVDQITVENLPEYNDDFVKENTEYTSVKEYNEVKKKELTESKEEEYKNAAIYQIVDYLVANSTFDGYPEELYTQCEEYYDAENESYASMYGMELDAFLEMMGIDEDTRKEQIEDSVHYELVIGAVAQEEGIDCTEKEVKDFIDDNYAEYGYESAKAFLEEYSEEDVGYQLVYEKVVEFLYDKAKYVDIDEETYLKQQEDMYGEEEVEETSDEGETTEETSDEKETEKEASDEEETTEETSDKKETDKEVSNEEKTTEKKATEETANEEKASTEAE